MASKTEIANRVAFKLGQPRISNIDSDPGQLGRVFNGLWDTVRVSCLQTYPWNFAIKRTDLAASATEPSWGFANAYPVPSDCLQILDIQNDPDYKIEGGSILCDATGALYIRYIADISDSTLFSPVFVEYFSHRMAIEACERITADNSLKTSLLTEMRSIEAKAMSTDAIEERSVDRDEDTWLTARV